MKHEKITIQTKNSTQAKLYTYFMDNYEEIDINRTRPIVIICPGGGYEITSDREAEAIAVQYMAMGFHACVVRYSVQPVEFPQALCELAWRIAYLREHSSQYGINKEKILVTGFSAGGHLAASIGVFWQEEWLQKETGISKELMRPNGLILCYPVITSGKYAHRSSFTFLMGKKYNDELNSLLSLENQVSSDVPPVFIWHTLTDQTVPVENTFLFVEALRKKKVSVEMHIFPKGEHGLSLANEETQSKENGFGIEKCCQCWIELAGKWIRNL